MTTCHEDATMHELLNFVPTALLGLMFLLTLLLLPLLNDERPSRAERQRTEEIRVPVVRRKDEG
jgi:hypothetical protein